MSGRACDWCHGPIPEGARRDALTCSKRCRQARHRFHASVGTASPVVDGHPRRIAYADPPYPGKSELYYGDHPDFGGEVDHAALIATLSADFDAWALSTSAAALQDVLALCPPGVRVAAWFRGHRPNKAAILPLNSWEPVIYGGQVMRRVAPVEHDPSRPTSDATAADPSCSPEDTTPVAQDLHDASRGPERRVARIRTTPRVDSLYFRPAARTTDPRRVTGAKPAEFCRWLFELLAAQPGDEFVDVFPGSGGVARAWEVYTLVEDDHEASRSAAARHDASRATVVDAS